MGYRSEVSYVMRFKDQAQLDTFIGVQLCKKDEVINEALKELKQIETTGTGGNEDQYLIFYANDVKWYDDYPDVKVHHAFMRELIADYEDTAWLFIRCGEQADDLQEDSDGEDGWSLYEFISVCRPSIQLDIDFDKLKPILNENNELTEGELA